MKTCSNKSCLNQNPQDESNFQRDNRSKDGTQRYCRDCTKLKKAERKARLKANLPSPSKIARIVKTHALVKALPENGYNITNAYRAAIDPKATSQVAHDFLKHATGEPLKVLKNALTHSKYMTMVLRFLDQAEQSDNLIFQERAIAMWLKMIEVLGNKLGLDAGALVDKSTRDDLFEQVLKKYENAKTKEDYDA